MVGVDRNRMNEHLCLDLRVFFFAGAPSKYMSHPLAKTFNSLIDIAGYGKSRYQRRLIPLGGKTIFNEKECTLPDETVLKMNDIWTATD